MARTCRPRRLQSSIAIPSAPDIGARRSGNASVTSGLPSGSDVAGATCEREFLPHRRHWPYLRSWNLGPYHLAGEADQDRRQSCPPWPVRDIPIDRGCGAEGIVPEKPEAQGKGLIEIGNYPTRINPRRSPYQGFTAIRPWVSILLRNGRDPASLKYCSTAFTQPCSVG